MRNVITLFLASQVIIYSVECEDIVIKKKSVQYTEGMIEFICDGYHLISLENEARKIEKDIERLKKLIEFQRRESRFSKLLYWIVHGK